ncbi:hypothetical protein K431DRAFT_165331 [Polychaeton citri CBS 116435]|uniref:Uncharacterized protein n=1 Tax=Polychaeton citri CBS 116435 TaxID=1314669 RepID=A0A9P4URN2_9PEZI|nr:hypothetical protein K431DRAFT_165331 [Polychaeton citri CBS 116435]
MSIRHDFLCNGGPIELARYFRHDLKHVETASLSKQLIDSVAHGSIPPTVFWFWLRLDRDQIGLAIRDALRQETSILVRRYAMQEVGRRLRTPSWAKVWNALGGIEGMLDLYSTLSVNEVRYICRAIGMSAASTQACAARQSELDGLLRALCSRHFPDSKFQNPDERSLDKYYALIVPACSSDMVASWQSLGHLPEALTERRLQVQKSYRQICIAKLFENPEKELQRYQCLVRSVPDLPSNEEGFSESMKLARDLIGHVNSANLKVDRLMVLVILPLIRRMDKRKAPIAAKLNVLQLTTEYILNNKSLYATRSLGLEPKRLLFYAIRFWSRCPDAFEQVLVDLFQFIPHVRNTLPRLTVERLSELPVDRRYPLLKLLMRNVPGCGLNIESDSDLAAEPIWPVSLFFVLPAPRARALRDRIVRSRGTNGMLPYDYYDWPHGSMFKSLGRLPDASDGGKIFDVYLHRDLPGSYEGAESLVESLKQQASTTSDQANRSQWIKATLQSSVASGSLDLLKNTILWVRRFNRDVKTVKDLYSGQNIHRNEWRKILGGVASPATTAEQVSERIKKANEILLELLHTACMVLKEPTFSFADWHGVLSLFAVVVQERLTRAERLQKHLAVEDSKFFHTIWRPTIDVLIEAERIGNRSGNEKLRFNDLRGALGLGRRSIDPISEMKLPTSWFLDTLAEERDQFWQQHRAAQKPAVMTLPDVFPKGLPVQCLQTIKVKHPSQDLPYIRSRAEGIVFISAANVKTPLEFSDEETKAIGQFVDNYTAALRLYIDIPCKGTTRTDRTTLAWRHALLDLSHDLMSTDEADLFWRDKFTQAGVQKDKVLPVRSPVEIPDVEDANEATEWSPYPDFRNLTIESRYLSSSMLNLILPLSTVYRPASRFWAIEQIATPRPGKTDEALLVSALLYLNSRFGPGTSLLKSPFPSANHARFPALFLEGDFIERPQSELGNPLDLLRTLLGRTPPELLASLTSSMMRHLGAGKNDSDQISYSMETLKLALESDNPLPSLQHMCQVVVDMPDQSSWHRHLLNKGTLSRLSPRHVEVLLDSIPTSIIAKFDSQAKADVGSQDASPKTPPSVKISTIKLLAQILRKADFVRHGFIVELLVKLLTKSKHVDIKAAAISSLLSMLEETGDSALQETIFGALAHVVPIAASLDERKQYTELDWEEFLSSNRVPDIGSESPILDTLIQATAKFRLTEPLRNRIVMDLLLPIFDASVKEHQKWHRCFLKACHQETFGTAFQWEVGCVQVKLFQKLIKEHLNIIPRRVVDIYYNMSRDMLDPDSKLNKITASLSKSAENPLNDSQGHHWVDLYVFGQAHHLGTFVQCLNSQWDPVDDERGIKPSHLQDAVIDLLKRAILAEYKSLSGLIAALKPPIKGRKERREIWEKNHRPVVKKLLEWIDRDIRTPQWKADIARHPNVLPDTFEMRLYLLSYPGAPIWEPENVERRETFSAELVSLLHEISQTLPYHHKFSQIKEVAFGIHEQSYINLAIALGSLNGKETLQEQTMRAELAMELLEDPKVDKQVRPSDDVAQAAVGMMRKLQNHPDEDIRRMASNAVNSLSIWSNNWHTAELKKTQLRDSNAMTSSGV